VRELVVLRDRMTQESKGSAFVWYASGADADKVRGHGIAACLVACASDTVSAAIAAVNAVRGGASFRCVLRSRVFLF
jgi:hypothetical protein